MHTSQHPRRRYAVALFGFGMFVLAACGSSGSGYSSPPASTAAPSNPHAGSGAVVSVATDTKLGSVLADANGRTLYTLTNNGTAVPCTSQCRTIWPPLLVPTGTATVNTATRVAGIGTAPVAGGTQVTEMNQPLYRYSGDTKPGDTNGDGINSFGGVWRAIRSVGATPTTASPATGDGPSGGNGY